MILTLGDSFTWGDELADRTAEAWPYLIAQQFDHSVVNLAEPGASNDFIVRLGVEQTIKQQYDLVVVAWADQNRLEVWSEVDRQIKSINSNSTFMPWIQDYYRHSYNDEYNLEKKSLQMLLLQQHFKQINQPYLFTNVSGRHFCYRKYFEKFSYIWKQYDLANLMGWYDGGLVEWAGDAPRGDRGHPLTLGHKRIAEKIAMYIQMYNKL